MNAKMQAVSELSSQSLQLLDEVIDRYQCRERMPEVAPVPAKTLVPALASPLKRVLRLRGRWGRAQMAR